MNTFEMIMQFGRARQNSMGDVLRTGQMVGGWREMTLRNSTLLEQIGMSGYEFQEQMYEWLLQNSYIDSGVEHSLMWAPTESTFVVWCSDGWSSAIVNLVANYVWGKNFMQSFVSELEEVFNS